jgi:hypothetical protein
MFCGRIGVLSYDPVLKVKVRGVWRGLAFVVTGTPPAYRILA